VRLLRPRFDLGLQAERDAGVYVFEVKFLAVRDPKGCGELAGLLDG
jgi:hypothetical protein